MEMNGAELIVKLLERQGIDTIFGIPGGANLPIYDALYHGRIRHILTRHEQGAGFMAQGVARTTGHAAVCMATSGPGATNLITALADAKLDSIPMVAITGQVNTSLIGTDAFQEVDTYGLALSVTKHTFLVQDAADLLTIIPEAFMIAESGRPGPVVIDVPKDVQTQTVMFEAWPDPARPEKTAWADPTAPARMAQMIHQARKPLFCAGGGVVAAGAADLLRKVARKNAIPVVSTLMGLGTMAYDDPMFLGMLGMHGSSQANQAMSRADLIIALGIRFDDRATGKIEEFCKDAAIIHVDVDASEIGKLKNASLGVCGDVSKVLTELLPLMETEDRNGWLQEITAMKGTDPVSVIGGGTRPHPAGLIRYIGTRAPEDTILATDVGQHQMWAAQAYPVRTPRTFLTSGGLGTMGFGLPTAIGAAFANTHKKVICLTGDGSFLMNIQELATLAEHDLNVTVILMDNGHLGLVRQQQELLYENHVFASKFNLSPDFAAIARGFGIRVWNAEMGDAAQTAIDQALAFDGPGLVHISIDWDVNVYPMVPPGASNLEMIEETQNV